MRVFQNYRNESIPACKLTVDHTYQRQERRDHVRKLARVFERGFLGAAFGCLIVSEREDGTLWVVDGQHRLLAFRVQFGAEENIPCLTYTGLTPQDEARVFKALNGNADGLNRPLTVKEVFRAGYYAGDPIEVMTIAAVENTGWFVDIDATSRKEPGQEKEITALRGLTRVCEHGQQQLEDVLSIIRDAWTFQKGTANTGTIEGIAQVIRRTGLPNDKILSVLPPDYDLFDRACMDYTYAKTSRTRRSYTEAAVADYIINRLSDRKIASGRKK